MSLDCTPPPLPQYSKFTPGYRLKLEPIIYYQIQIEPTKQWRQYSIPPTTLEESAPQHHHRKSIHLVHGRRRASVFVLSGSRYGSEFVFSSKHQIALSDALLINSNFTPFVRRTILACSSNHPHYASQHADHEDETSMHLQQGGARCSQCLQRTIPTRDFSRREGPNLQDPGVG